MALTDGLAAAWNFAASELEDVVGGVTLALDGASFSGGGLLCNSASHRAAVTAPGGLRFTTGVISIGVHLDILTDEATGDFNPGVFGVNYAAAGGGGVHGYGVDKAAGIIAKTNFGSLQVPIADNVGLYDPADDQNLLIIVSNARRAAYLNGTLLGEVVSDLDWPLGYGTDPEVYVGAQFAGNGLVPGVRVRAAYIWDEDKSAEAADFDDDPGGTTWAFASGGPTEQAVAGTITPAGTLTKQVLKSASGSIAPSAALTKAASKLFSGSTSPVGVLQRQALTIQSGTLTPAGELAAVRALLHATAGTVSPVGGLQRAPAKLAAGTVTPSGAITRDVGKTAGGSVSTIGTLTKASTRALSGSIAPSGALTALRSTLRAVAGTLGLSGTVTALRDVITQALTGAIALSGALIKRAEKQSAGTVTPSGAVTRAVWKRVDGTLEIAGTVRREVRKAFTATLPLTGLTVTVAGTFAEPGPHPLTIRFERHGKTIGFELHGKRIQFVKHAKTIDFEP